MTVSIPRSLTLFGHDITGRVESVTLDKTLNRLYHTATIELSQAVLIGCVVDNCIGGNCMETPDQIRQAVINSSLPMVLQIGSDTYRLYVIEVEKDHRENYTLLARTKGTFLAKPFKQKQTISGQGTSVRIMEDLLDEVGLSYLITTAPYQFKGGNFEMEGADYADAVERLCGVTGANFYQVGESVHITPAFRIPQSATPVISFSTTGNEVTDIRYSERNSVDELINNVIINPQYVDIFSIPKITLVNDTEYCEFDLLFNPTFDTIEEVQHQLGSIQITQKYFTEEYQLANTRLIETNGGILAISSLSINGTNVTEYTFEPTHNMIVLPAPRTGACKVSYLTKCIDRWSADGGVVSYLNQTITLTSDSATECDKTNDGTGGDTAVIGVDCVFAVDGNYTRATPVKVFYTGETLGIMLVSQDSATPVNRGGSSFVGAGGTVQYFTYTEQGDSGVNVFDKFISQTTYTSKTRQDKTTATIAKLDSGYGFYLPTTITPTSFMVGGSVISFQSGGSGKYTTSNGNLEGQTCTVFYSVTGYELMIPPCGSNNIKKYELYSCDKSLSVEFGSDDDDQDGNAPVPFGCTLPSTGQIDIANLLSVSIDKVAGQTVSSSFGNLVISSTGRVSVTITAAGTFFINVQELGLWAKEPITIEVQI